jgi:hypothetical protein
MFGRKTARERPVNDPKASKAGKRHDRRENLNPPSLAQNAPFAHLGAPRGCQSTGTSVPMAETRHSRRMFGRKTARKRPKRDQIRFTATGFGLEQDPRIQYCSLENSSTMIFT